MFKILADVLEGLVEKLGATVAGVALMIAGVVMLLPYFGIPAYICEGLGLFALGLGVVAFGKRAKKAADMMVTSEAEKRIDNPNLTPVSAVPQIQREIEKLSGAADPRK